MDDKRYKSYSDCNIDELEVIVEDLENMSSNALKNNKLESQIQVYEDVKRQKKSRFYTDSYKHLTLQTNREV